MRPSLGFVGVEREGCGLGSRFMVGGLLGVGSCLMTADFRVVYLGRVGVDGVVWDSVFIEGSFLTAEGFLGVGCVGMGGRLSAEMDIRAVCGGRTRLGGLLFGSAFVEAVWTAGVLLATGLFADF